MDVTLLKARLETVVSLVQVVEPAPGGFDLPVDTGTEFFTLFSTLFSTKVFPNTADDDTTLPQMIYRQVEMDSLEFDGYRLSQTDRFEITVKTATNDDLFTKLQSIATTLRTSSFAVDLIDFETGHDPQFATDGAYMAVLEIEFSYLVDSVGGPSGNLAAELPMALVYPIGRSASDELSDNFSIQRVDNQWGIVVATATGNMPTLLDDILTVLLGWQQGTAYETMRYQSGANIGGVGLMQLWREIYTDAIFIQE